MVSVVERLSWEKKRPDISGLNVSECMNRTDEGIVLEQRGCSRSYRLSENIGEAIEFNSEKELKYWGDHGGEYSEQSWDVLWSEAVIWKYDHDAKCCWTLALRREESMTETKAFFFNVRGNCLDIDMAACSIWCFDNESWGWLYGNSNKNSVG